MTGTCSSPVPGTVGRLVPVSKRKPRFGPAIVCTYLRAESQRVRRRDLIRGRRLGAEGQLLAALILDPARIERRPAGVVIRGGKAVLQQHVAVERVLHLQAIAVGLRSVW